MFKGLYFCGCILEEKISSRKNHCACSDRRHREIELRSTPEKWMDGHPPPPLIISADRKAILINNVVGTILLFIIDAFELFMRNQTVEKGMHGFRYLEIKRYCSLVIIPPSLI